MPRLTRIVASGTSVSRARHFAGHGTIVAILLLAALVFVTTRAAAAKPFWHDEIYTLAIAKLPRVHDVWAAHREGTDLAPPLNTLATRLTVAMFGSGPVSGRLPALAGYWTMTLVVFIMLRARTNLTLAITGALIPAQTAAFRYSYEARPYGLAMGLCALALFSWTEAARHSRRPLYLPVLALLLAAGVWTHYYGVFVIGLIAVAELLRQIRARRIDRPMWLAIAVPAAAAIPLLPVLRSASKQRSHFWARPDAVTASEAYSFLLQPLIEVLWSVWGIAILALLVVGMVRERRARGRTGAAPGRPRPAASPGPFHEVCAFSGGMLLPLAMLAAAPLTGAFTPRYGLLAVPAFALALPIALRWAARREWLPHVVLCAAFLLPFGRAVVDSFDAPAEGRPNPVEQRALLMSALSAPGPIVCSGSLTFLQLWYYTPPALRGRLVYLADPDAAVRFTGSDTFDRGYLGLAKRTAVSVEPYDTFMERHREFRIYAAGSGWLLDRLQESGARIDAIGTETGGRLYRVSH